jgi:hypothetical protein
MKKHCSVLIAAIAACCVFYSAASAADWATSAGSCYAQGDKYLDVGIPLPMYPAGVHAAFDYAFHDAISGGGGMGFRYYYGWSAWYYNSVYITFLGRAAFHPFNLKVLEDKIKVRDKLDVYAGLTTWIGASLNGFSPDWPWLREYIGLRWHFSPKFCLFVEDCGGFGWLDGGITFKF